MNKIIALLRNEWTKVLRRKIIYLVVGLIVLSIFSMGVIYKLTRTIPNYTAEDFSIVKQNLEFDLEKTNSEIKRYEDLLGENSSVNSTEPSESYHNLNKALEQSKHYKLSLEIALDKEINLFNYGYQTDLINEMAALYLMKELAVEENNSQRISELEQKIVHLDQILNQNNYARYIDYQIENVKKNPLLNDQQKAVRISDWELELIINPKGHAFYPAKNYFNNLMYVRDTSMEAISKSYVDYSPLLPSELSQAKKDFQIANFYLARSHDNLPEIDSGGNVYPGFAVTFGTYGMIFLIIILAGSTISQEISTGSIKGLIIAPVRRQKIFYAKLINIISVSIIGMLIVFLATLASSHLFIESFFHLPYAFITGSSLQVMPFSFYILALCLAKTSSVIMAGLFALMFSSTTRSTSISVGVSMITQFGLMAIYNFFKLVLGQSYTLMSFLPFEYLDLTKHILPPIYGVTSESSFMYGYTLLNSDFALATPSFAPYLYWLVMAICLIWIARDSFVKRDL